MSFPRIISTKLVLAPEVVVYEFLIMEISRTTKKAIQEEVAYLIGDDAYIYVGNKRLFLPHENQWSIGIEVKSAVLFTSAYTEPSYFDCVLIEKHNCLSLKRAVKLVKKGIRGKPHTFTDILNPNFDWSRDESVSD